MALIKFQRKAVNVNKNLFAVGDLKFKVVANSLKGLFLWGSILTLLGSCQKDLPSDFLNRTLLVPFYARPTVNESDWDFLLSTKPIVKTYLIINPLFLPPQHQNNVEETAYRLLLGPLREKGYKILIYLSTNYLQKNPNDLANEANNWIQAYGIDNIDGFFLDRFNDPSNQHTHRDRVRDYKAVLPAGKLIVIHPELNIPAEVYPEVDYVVKGGWQLPTFEAYWDIIFSQPVSSQDCFFVYHVNTLEKALDLRSRLLEKQARCYYISHEKHEQLTRYWRLLQH